MGYYSDFHVDDTDIVGIKEVLENYSDPYTWESYDHLPYLHAKWYDWIKDLQKLAEDYPTSYLVIIRYGEESPDMERAIVRGGKVVTQKPEIIWPAE